MAANDEIDQSAPLWSPSAERARRANIVEFSRSLGADGSFTAAHNVSLSDPERFWMAVWEQTGTIGQPGPSAFTAGRRSPAVAATDDTPRSLTDARFFPDATLNVAENLLSRCRDSDAAEVDAIIFHNESGDRVPITWAELYDRVAYVQSGLLAAGVVRGDAVAAWLPNIPEAVVLFLAAAGLGVTFSSCSPDFGAAAVIDRFGQLAPRVLVACDGYRYGGKSFDCLERLETIVSNLPSLRQTVILSEHGGEVEGAADMSNAVSWATFIGSAAVARTARPKVRFVQVPFDDECVVLFSSGTTGSPKAIVHRAGGLLLKLATEHRFHCDISKGDRVFYYTTTGWMMWNWLVFTLGVGASIILYDGAPMTPTADALFRIVDDERATLMGVSAKYLEAAEAEGVEYTNKDKLQALRTICSTGSPLSPQGFKFVYAKIKADVHLASISGGTDLCGCLLAGDPTAPVYPGELQRPTLGLDIDSLDKDGNPMPRGEAGELVCRTAFPSMPLRFVGDEDGDRLRAAYYERYPGLWHQGDYVLRSEHGWVILGRSDATLNVAGVRIGTAEIYRPVEAMPEVQESVAVAQEWGSDSRIVLFVRLAEGYSLNPDFVKRLRAKVRREASPRHVPAVVLAVSDLPRTRSGKISEIAVREAIHGRPIKNAGALLNPEVLAEFFEKISAAE